MLALRQIIQYVRVGTQLGVAAVKHDAANNNERDANAEGRQVMDESH